MEIELQFPVDFEGGQLKKIELRRPKVSDMVKARKGLKDEAEQEVALIAKLSNLPPATIEDLDVADYKKIQEVLTGFFG